MNIHADDIGLSIVVPGGSYTLWLYATYCYCILCGFYTVRARARQRLITEYYPAGAVQGDYTGNLNTKMLVQQKNLNHVSSANYSLISEYMCMRNWT